MRPKLQNVVVDSLVAQEVTKMVNSVDKTQFDIAHEMGLAKSNIITMFKQGRTKLPLRLVVPLSKACNQDPAILMRICLEEYAPEILEALGDAFKVSVSEDEQKILATIRRAKTNKEKKRQEGVRKKATNETEHRLANIVRCHYDTSPEGLRGLYDYVSKNLVA